MTDTRKAQIIADDVRPMLREFLDALGFEAMARDVATETDWTRLQHYARIILRQLPTRRDIHNRFAMLRLV